MVKISYLHHYSVTYNKIMRRIQALRLVVQTKSVILNKRKLSLHVKEEIKHALEKKKPVVALESTIITHGMPFPQNIECAKQVEDVVRHQGAVPATIAIINGKVEVGLTEDEINILGDTKTSVPIKASRRDISYVVSTKSNGGTTVSGTLLVANKARIPIFATGGIGGVHRGSETTFDISADLTELGRTGVAVVSSGVKSILDIPKTLEYLETQGVFVATFGESNEFPAFYSRKSGCQVPYFTENVDVAARIIKTHRELGVQSGMLFAVPIPEEYALDSIVINEAIEEALGEAKRDGVKGKNITPYLLSKIALITEGQSLQSNIALIKNNAKVAASIAVALSTLDSEENLTKRVSTVPISLEAERKPVVVGGSNLDCSVMLKTSEIKLDGRIYDANFTYTAGGVGRNICEAMSKLGSPPDFLTVLGDDHQGRTLQDRIPEECRRYVRTTKSRSTAQCTIVFDGRGGCRMLMGDMEIHKEITPQMIQENENVLKNSTMIILDANLSLETMEECLKIAEKHRIPVFYEPTDFSVSTKPFQTKYSHAIKYISPNLNELRCIASFLGISSSYPFKMQEAAHISTKLLNFIDNILVTLGSDGLLIARRGSATDNFQENLQLSSEHVRHYPIEEIHDLVNVSGAGDCFSSGFIAAAISGMSEEVCVSVGFAAAKLALQCQAAVPIEMFDKGHECWKTPAKYQTIL